MTTEEIAAALKNVLITRLQLKIAPEDIGYDTPLFGEGEGLGLDSIEALELVVGIEEEFGVAIDDSGEVMNVFYSVHTLSDHIKAALDAKSA